MHSFFPDHRRDNLHEHCVLNIKCPVMKCTVLLDRSPSLCLFLFFSLSPSLHLTMRFRFCNVTSARKEKDKKYVEMHSRSCDCISLYTRLLCLSLSSNERDLSEGMIYRFIRDAAKMANRRTSDECIGIITRGFRGKRRVRTPMASH